MMMQKQSLLLWFVLSLFLSSVHAETISLVTGERAPYISKNQIGYGYAYRVVEQAFAREGDQLNVTFYPWARADAVAKEGQADGVMPLYHADTKHFLVSDGFPGGAIGLLKRKNDAYRYPMDPSLDKDAVLASLSGKRIALVRGSHLFPDIERRDDIHLVMVNRDLQGIDMLNAGRVDFVLIDKYTAASLMIENRPHYIGQLEFLNPPLTEKPLHVAFAKGAKHSQHLVSVFNRGLAAIKKDGTLSKIQAEFGLMSVTEHKDSLIHLTVGTVKNADMIIMKQHIHAFESAHPDIKVDWYAMDENMLRRRLLSDHALGEEFFDVVTIGNYEVPIWARKKWIMPLDPLPESYDVDDIFPALRAALSVEGKLYALPFYAESIVTYYRPDLFRKAGLTMPAQPTFDQVLQFARDVHRPKDGIYGICLRGKAGWGQNMGLVTSLVHAFGGRWFDMNWHPQLTSPQWQAAITFYQQALTLYGPPKPERNGYLENLALFAHGQCGMWIDVTVAAGTLYNPKMSEVANKIAITSAPKAQNTASWLWAWTFAISGLSSHKQQAKTFITWATSKDYIQHIGQHDSWISVPPGTRISTYQYSEYRRIAPFSDFVLHSLKGATHDNAIRVPTPYQSLQYVDIPEFVGIGGRVGQNMVKVLNGTLSVGDALTRSQLFTLRLMRAAGYVPVGSTPSE